MKYLLKPIRYPDIKKYMNRAQDKISRAKDKFYPYITKKMTKSIPYKDIRCFASVGQHVEINTVSGVYREWKRMNALEKDLPPEFIRCHRAFIVNILRVEQLMGCEVVLDDKSTIHVSDTYIKNVREQWIFFHG